MTPPVGEGLGVIFDVDGVLVDSFYAHRTSWQRLAGACGVPFSDDDFEAGFGRTSREIILESWPETHHDDERIRQLDDQKEAWYREIIADDFPSMDGAVELIDALSESGFAIGAGSSGPPENVSLALQRLEREATFTGVVTGMDVERGKPAPDVFLMCAERLGIEPSRCLVIEDAPAGVEAASRASMAAVALLSTGRRARDFKDFANVKTVNSLRKLSPDACAGLIFDHGERARA